METFSFVFIGYFLAVKYKCFANLKHFKLWCQYELLFPIIQPQIAPVFLVKTFSVLWYD